MPGELSFVRPTPDSLLIRFSGQWKLETNLPAFSDVIAQIDSGPAIRRVAFDTRALEQWDSRLVTFLLHVLTYCQGQTIEVDRGQLPDGVLRLLDLAMAVPERSVGRQEAAQEAWLFRVGTRTLAGLDGAKGALTFVGEAVQTLAKFAGGKARYRRVDLWVTIEECGVKALPIVSLISLLVGLILAFVGAIQLRQFGAQIYVANLVGLGMAREMGAMMTGIMMAGRTGAAFAAQLGTMRVNQEIDALSTMGIPPMEFLVLPRLLALMLMMPLLCLYSDLLGILGGLFVGITVLDLGMVQYLQQTQSALSLLDFVLGLIKSAVFGVLVAMAGCLRGMQCGNSSAAVGLAATSAVVTAIVCIIVSDSVLTIVYNALGV